jgi:hypothetical protein
MIREIYHKHKTKIALLLIVTTVLTTTYFIANQSYIVIDLKDFNDTVKLTVTDVSSGDFTITDVEANQVKQRVPTGNYTVTVDDGQTKFLTHTNTGRFFATTQVETSRVEQNERRYLAENPNDCVGVSGVELVSWSCGGPIATADEHVLATDDRPGFKREVNGPRSWLVEGFITVGDSSFVGLKVESDSSLIEGAFSHEIFPRKGSIIDPFKGSDYDKLTSDITYSLTSDEDGFTYYYGSNEALEVFRFGSLSDDLNKFTISQDDESLSLFSVDLSGNKQPTALFVDDELVPIPQDVNKLAALNFNLEEEINSINDSVYNPALFVCGSNCPQESYELNPLTTQAVLCGDSKLCTIERSSLNIFDIGNELSLDANINDVSKIIKTNRNILIMRSDGVVNFNPETLSGSYGLQTNQEVCGINTNTSSSSYLVCLQDETGKTNVLEVNPDEPASILIDRVIAELRSIDSVENISVSNGYVYVTPLTGDPVFNQKTGFYEYDQQLLNTAVRNISNKVSSSSLVGSSYKVINTLNGERLD